MKSHNELINKLEMEHALNAMAMDGYLSELRLEMVAKYGEGRILKFEESIADGDGIKVLLDKWKSKVND